MELVSKNLLLSLKQDLKVLNAISLEITQNVNSFEVNSWLFPTKSYKEVSQNIPGSTSENKQYLLHLELMVDRLYLIVNLVTKYLETHQNTSGEHDTPKNVVRPKNLSLGASTELMWKKVLESKNLTIIHPSKAVTGIHLQERMLSSKYTQTKTYFSSMCNSCCTATSCIKEIANELALQIDALALRKIRKDLQEDICDITQYGCMYRLTTGIIEDVKNFVEQLESVKVQNKNCKEDLENVTLKYSESLKIIKNLESSFKVITKRFRKVKIKNAALLKSIKELTQYNRETENTIQLERAKVATLTKSIEESTISLALLGSDNDKLQKDYTQTMSDSLGALSERDMWKSRFSETYLENRRLKSEVDNLHLEIDSFQSSMNKINNGCEQLSQKLETNNTNIERRSEMFENFIKRVTDVETNKIKAADAVVEFNSSSFIPVLTTFQVKGDPVADMKEQVEVNLFNIKQLEQYNCDLLRTIHRIQEKAIST